MFGLQCLVQLGWFPDLFFSTVYIGGIYTHAVPPPTIPADTTLSEQAARVGFHALLFSALVGLVTITVLPVAVAKVQSRMKIRHLGSGLAALWCLRQGLFAFAMAGTWWVPPQGRLGCDNSYYMHGVLLCSYSMGPI